MDTKVEEDFEAIAQRRITDMLGKLVVENVSLRAQLEVLMKHVRETNGGAPKEQE